MGKRLLVFLAAIGLALGLVVSAQPSTAAPARVKLRVVVVDFPGATVKVVLQKKRGGRWVKARARRLGPRPSVGGYNTARVTFTVRPGRFRVKARSAGKRTRTAAHKYRARAKPTAVYVSFPRR